MKLRKNNFKEDMKKSIEFYQNNKEIIKSLFNGKLFNIEFDDSELADLLDMKSGIDYIVEAGGNVYGIASRINFNKYHHNNITIRYKRATGTKTEFEKRCESISKMDGSIYASITMQIDAEENKFIRGIIFQSDKLYMVIMNNIEYFEKKYMRINHNDGNKFFRISHNKIKEYCSKYDIKCKIVEEK